jgi:hypothetical protein
MLEKCVNSSCSARFRYLDEGRLFRVEYNPGLQSFVRLKPQYFWLCSSCSETMSLRLDRETTVRTVVKLDDSRHGRKDVDFIPLERKEGLLLSCLGAVNRHRSIGWHGLASESLACAG